MLLDFPQSICLCICACMDTASRWFLLLWVSNLNILVLYRVAWMIGKVSVLKKTCAAYFQRFFSRTSEKENNRWRSDWPMQSRLETETVLMLVDVCVVWTSICSLWQVQSLCKVNLVSLQWLQHLWTQWTPHRFCSIDRFLLCVLYFRLFWT